MLPIATSLAMAVSTNGSRDIPQMTADGSAWDAVDSQSVRTSGLNPQLLRSTRARSTDRRSDESPSRRPSRPASGTTRERIATSARIAAACCIAPRTGARPGSVQAPGPSLLSRLPTLGRVALIWPAWVGRHRAGRGSEKVCTAQAALPSRLDNRLDRAKEDADGPCRGRDGSKRSQQTIEVMDAEETVLGGGRYGAPRPPATRR